MASVSGNVRTNVTSVIASGMIVMGRRGTIIAATMTASDEILETTAARSVTTIVQVDVTGRSQTAGGHTQERMTEREVDEEILGIRRPGATEVEDSLRLLRRMAMWRCGILRRHLHRLERQRHHLRCVVRLREEVLNRVGMTVQKKGKFRAELAELSNSNCMIS